PPVRVTITCHRCGSPPQARIPHAGRMTAFRQVSWLAGLRPSPPSQILLRQDPVALGEGLAADSCGSSSGFDLPSADRTEFPPGRSTRSTRLSDPIEIHDALTVNNHSSAVINGAMPDANRSHLIKWSSGTSPRGAVTTLHHSPAAPAPASAAGRIAGWSRSG